GFGLPGNGRKIDGSTAQRLLCRVLPAAMDASLRWQELDQDAVREFVSTVEDSTALRDSLEDLGLVAFVADGSVLPRRSGVDDRALADDDVVTFTAPPSLRTEVELPNRGWVAGMGVPEGISLVVGRSEERRVGKEWRARGWACEGDGQEEGGRQRQRVA